MKRVVNIIIYILSNKSYAFIDMIEFYLNFRLKKMTVLIEYPKEGLSCNW
jgi:hypothetical protein